MTDRGEQGPPWQGGRGGPGWGGPPFGPGRRFRRGAFVALLETATGVKAFSVGKPSPIMMRAARKELDLTTDQTTMIGDQAAAERAGL